MNVNWILSNLKDALFLACDYGLKEMCVTTAVVVLVVVVAVKLFPKYKKEIRRIGVMLTLLAVFAVGAIRIYQRTMMGSDQNPKHDKYSVMFNDVQKTQIAAAKKYGISPIKDRAAAQEAIKSGTLVELSDCSDYKLARMGYSLPYLTANAAEILEKIGSNFRDSLSARGICEHKIVVTSVLRTDADVEKLMKNNTVAVKNSAHRHATTFDISYIRYEPVGLGLRSDIGTLKSVLAGVLDDLREEELCYVKYEINQACFHITVRK